MTRWSSAVLLAALCVGVGTCGDDATSSSGTTTGGGAGGAGGTGGSGSSAGGSSGAGGTAPTLQEIWSETFGSTGADRAVSVAVDGAGRLIVAGQFTGSVDFGGGALVSAGGSDAFVAAFSSTGAHIWSRQIGGPGDDAGWSVAVSAADDVVLAGSFSSTVDFGAGGVASAGLRDLFVVKLSSAGTNVWSRQIGGPGDDVASGVAVHTNGNVGVTGAFSQSADFGGGPLTSAGLADAFVLALTGAGAHVWSRQIGGPGDDAGTALAFDAGGNVGLTGAFSQSVDFGGGALVSAGLGDIFVAKLASSAGAHVWSRQIGGPGDDVGTAVAVAGSGDLVVTGGFSQSVDFGGGALVSAGQRDAFLLKLTPTGAHAVSRQIGGPGDDIGRGAAIDPAGNIFLAGSFSQSVDFGAGTFTSAGGTDAFAATFNTIGGPGDSIGIGGPGDDEALAVAVGSIILAGSFEATIDFGAGPHTSAGQSDAFVVELSSSGGGTGGGGGAGGGGTGCTAPLTQCPSGCVDILTDPQNCGMCGPCGGGEVCFNAQCIVVCTPGVDPGCCTNGFLDPGESDIDCGGPTCFPCSTGKGCGVNDDCAPSSECAGNVCTDCGCVAGDYCSSGLCTPQLANTTTCATNSSCLSGQCIGGFCGCDSTRECTNCLDDDSDTVVDRADPQCVDRLDNDETL